MNTRPSRTALWLRVVAGVLAMLAFCLTGLRLYHLSVQGIPMGADSIMPAMRLLFPLSLGLFFGYLAWKGRLPFSES
jgi:hypothetical protein